MNVQIIFEGANQNNQAVKQIITEDTLFASRSDANQLLKTLGSRIDRIETNEGTQTIYIKPIENVLCG
tara:strand:+ start:15828 stop:16031 length:204 start_codon:yes stop_codon:yes gene_type:complete